MEGISILQAKCMWKKDKIRIKRQGLEMTVEVYRALSKFPLLLQDRGWGLGVKGGIATTGHLIAPNLDVRAKRLSNVSLNEFM